MAALDRPRLAIRRMGLRRVTCRMGTPARPLLVFAFFAIPSSSIKRRADGQECPSYESWGGVPPYGEACCVVALGTTILRTLARPIGTTTRLTTGTTTTVSGWCLPPLPSALRRSRVTPAIKARAGRFTDRPARRGAVHHAAPRCRFRHSGPTGPSNDTAVAKGIVRPGGAGRPQGSNAPPVFLSRCPSSLIPRRTPEQERDPASKPGHPENEFRSSVQNDVMPVRTMPWAAVHFAPTSDFRASWSFRNISREV